MLQTVQVQRSFSVVSICNSGSKLLRKCESSVIYRMPKPAPISVVRIEPIVEAYREPATPITLRVRRPGCAFHGSPETLGFSKATQIQCGFDTRKVCKSIFRATSARKRGLRNGGKWCGKSQSWKDRGTRKQWE